MTPRRVSVMYHLCALTLVLVADLVGAAAFSFTPMPEEAIVSPVVRNVVYLVMSLVTTVITPLIMLHAYLRLMRVARKFFAWGCLLLLSVFLVYGSVALAAAPVEGFAILTNGHLNNDVLRWVPSTVLFLMFAVGTFSVVAFHFMNARWHEPEADSPVVLIEYLHPVTLPTADLPVAVGDEDEDDYPEDDGTDGDDFFEDTDVVASPSPTDPVAAKLNGRQRHYLRHRARLDAATIPGQKPSRELLSELRSGTCVYCGDPASHADHIRPLSRGGWNHELNLVAACEVCNSHLKRSQLLVEWMRTCPAHVLRGALTSPSVLQEFVYEMRHIEALKFAYPASNEMVRNACLNHGFPELIREQQTVVIPLSRARTSLEMDSLPLPPIASEHTRPNINDRIARSWLAIGEKKAVPQEPSQHVPELAGAV